MTERADERTLLRVRRANPWLFFVVVFCWSWAFWIGAAALKMSVLSPVGQGLELIGLLGPMLGGIGLTYLTQDRESQRDYWARIVDPRRIPALWYAVIVFFAPVLWTLALLIETALGDALALAEIGGKIAAAFASPSTTLALLTWTILFGPIPEEFGWRGYVLDRLQARWSALVASLILGVVWAIYHLPLFYMRDTYHAAQGAWSSWFWLFMIQVVALAIVFTWIFNNTRRSTLAAILFHFVINLTAQLANLTGRTNFIVTLLWVGAAILIVAIYGPATLTRRESKTSLL